MGFAITLTRELGAISAPDGPLLENKRRRLFSSKYSMIVAQPIKGVTPHNVQAHISAHEKASNRLN